MVLLKFMSQLEIIKENKKEIKILFNKKCNIDNENYFQEDS